MNISLINMQYVKSAKSYLMNSTYALKRIGEGGDVISIQRFATDAKTGMVMAASKVRQVTSPQALTIVALLQMAVRSINHASDALKVNNCSLATSHIHKAQQDFDKAVQYLYVLDSQLHRGSKS